MLPGLSGGKGRVVDLRGSIAIIWCFLGEGRKGELRRSIPCCHGFSLACFCRTFTRAAALSVLCQLASQERRLLRTDTCRWSHFSSPFSQATNHIFPIFFFSNWNLDVFLGVCLCYGPYPNEAFFFCGISSKKKKVNLPWRLGCLAVASRLACFLSWSR